MFRGKRVETVDRITEGACIANMLPGKGSQARCKSNISICVNLCCAKGFVERKLQNPKSRFVGTYCTEV